MSQKEQMLHDIGIVDFNRIKNDMVKEFSERFFPITKDHAESEEEWRWGMAPLPWEGEC